MFVNFSSYTAFHYKPGHFRSALPKKYFRFYAKKIEPDSIKKKFDFINLKLNLLADNKDLFKTFAELHSFCLTGEMPVIDFGIITCKNTAHAVTQYNLFKHSHYKNIEDIQKLEEELQDNEEGTFLLHVLASDFVNKQGWKVPFQGHAFTVIKVIEDGKIGYRLAQSYVDRYSLKNFLEKNDTYYDSFVTLKNEVLEPFYRVLKFKGPWTMETCEDYKCLTGVSPVYLIGHHPDRAVIPSGQLLECAGFGRTTNKEEGFLMGTLKARQELNKQTIE